MSFFPKTVSSSVENILNDLSPIIPYYLEKYKVLSDVEINVSNEDGIIFTNILKSRVKTFHDVVEFVNYMCSSANWLYTFDYLDSFSLVHLWKGFAKNNKGRDLLETILKDVRVFCKVKPEDYDIFL